MQTKLKISTTILYLHEDYENLKKTIDSIQNEIDNVFLITDKNYFYNDLKYETILIKKFNGDYSDCRNSIKYNLPNHLLFHLNCGETLETKNIKDYLEEEKNYKINVIYDQFILKEIRITTKKDFTFYNKVYETLSCENCLNSIIKINTNKITKNNYSNYLSDWEKKEPLNSQVLYYKAIDFLYKGDYKNFIIESEKVIFKQNLNEENDLLIRYYLCNVFLYKEKNSQKFIQNILTLLAKKPEMPEFWCMAGDYWYLNNNFKNAKQFYTYATLAARHRDFNDNMFYMPEKYHNYPNKMIKNCDEILKKHVSYFSKKLP